MSAGVVGGTGATDSGDPGTMLRNARKRMGVTAGEVADALHLDQAVILAIEESRLDDLPAHAYAQGYVRTYARLLGLDADIVTARFNEVSRDRAAPPAPQPWSHPGSLNNRPPRRAGWRYTLVVIGLLTVAGALLWIAWRFVDLPVLVANRFGSTDPPAEPAPALAPNAPAQPEDTVEPPLPPSDGDPALAEPAPVASDPPAAGTDGASPETVADDASSIPVQDDPATEVDELTMRFNAESWVTVEDSTGKELYADLGAPDSSVTVTGTAPFAVLVGYAPGVDMFFNGDRVTLQPHTRDNVARLVLAN